MKSSQMSAREKAIRFYKKNLHLGISQCAMKLGVTETELTEWIEKDKQDFSEYIEGIGRQNLFILDDFIEFPSTSACIQNKFSDLEIRVLKQEVVEANHYISTRLDVLLGTKLFYLEKMRFVKGIPVSIDKSYIPYEKVKGMEEVNLNNTSYYQALKEHCGLEFKRLEQEILITQASEEEKKSLLLKDDEICFIRGVTYCEDIKPLEYFETAAMPNFYRFRSVTRRD